MVEEAKYTVVRTIGDLEIRRYAGMVLASVPVLPDDDAFRILFRYITGNNRSREEIAMTTPVVSSAPRSEKIAMTAPVLTDPDSFAFVLPTSYNIVTAPLPLDRRIRLVEVKPRLVAVLRFRGRAGDSQVQKETEGLMSALREHGIREKGPPFLMRYNPPFTPGFLRRNEVGVEVDYQFP